MRNRKSRNNRPGPETGRARGRKILSAALLLLALNALAACGPVPHDGGAAAEHPRATEKNGIRVLVDGESLPAAPEEQEKAAGLWVTVSVDGAAVAELPFEEKHTVKIGQDGIGENTVILTGEAVYMQEADCPGRDCVSMGEVTRENLETRVMGGFIICLPHRLSVEVWEKK